MTGLVRRVAAALENSDDWYRESPVETRRDGEFSFCVEHYDDRAAAIAVAAFKEWLQEQGRGFGGPCPTPMCRSTHGAKVAVAALLSALEEP